MRIIHLLGISGVDPHETPAARAWAHRLEWPMLLVALWIPVEWYLEETGAVGLDNARYFDWAMWLIFLSETSLLSWLVRDKKRYLRANWMNLVIIIGGFPLEWTYTPLVGAIRNLRLLLMMFVLLRFSRSLRQFLSRRQVSTVLMVSAVVVLLSGIIVTRLDPSMGSIWDGMWWAWVTVTHTGYGDIVPTTGASRFFGAMVILLGVVLVSLLTATMSAFFIGGEVEKVEKEERKEDIQLKDIAARLDRIESLLAEQQKTSPPPESVKQTE